MITRKYFLRQYNGLAFRHGGTGYVDLETILLRNGYISVELPYPTDQRWYRKPARLLSLMRWVIRIGRGDELVFIHPVFGGMNALMVKLFRARKAQPVCIIGDITGVKTGDAEVLEKELAFFRSMDFFVVHNAAMERWLMQRHPAAHTARLQWFDYLVPVQETYRELSGVIVFAGLLSKSGFLQKLGEAGLKESNLHFNLYGDGLPASVEKLPNVSFRGVFTPHELPAKMEGSFGLVWEGDGLSEQEGAIGLYSAIISHHKMSLYIVSGLPVIIHANSGCAQVVREQGIGLVVNSLTDIPAAISSLDGASYEQMRINMRPIARLISTGVNLERALKELSH